LRPTPVLWYSGGRSSPIWGRSLNVKTLLPSLVKSIPGVSHLARMWTKWQPLLDERLVEAFHGTGHLVIDSGIPESVLDRAVRDYSARPEVAQAKKLHHGARVFNAWETSKAIKAIATWPRVMRILRQLYLREPLPFQTLNFPIGTEQRLHSDIIHFHSDPPSFMCGVWVALEDIDRDNGALVYYPGSHKLREVSMEDVAAGPGPEHYPKYEDLIAKVVADSGIEPEFGVLKKGQALIWAANLIHGGSKHLDKSRTRHSQVTHYYFEGCQYYQPLDSYGGYRHLKRLKWIR